VHECKPLPLGGGRRALRLDPQHPRGVDRHASVPQQRPGELIISVARASAPWQHADCCGAQRRLETATWDVNRASSVDSRIHSSSHLRERANVPSRTVQPHSNRSTVPNHSHPSLPIFTDTLCSAAPRDAPQVQSMADPLQVAEFGFEAGAYTRSLQSST